jgi:Tol biopolymer transport system component/predicted Ser/Thr protein kinase
MALTVGTRLGPYEILAPIGAGGMGEVYRAKDTKLKREVALKVLPDSFASDPERMARFQREAEVLAALNHPNIAAIYGVEERALVMELVPGESLKGQVLLEIALNYAKQIADALEAAHEKNIIHRDLKPANIMVTPSGVVKVLDFGLAAVAQAFDPSNPANSPTLTISPTRAGMILGTAAYMSPEQARGKAVDKRADIWAFGVVLYEILTGQRLFAGETVSDTLAQVLTKEPGWAQVPAKVRRLLKKCLEKDPKKRLRDIGDAWELLEEETGTASSRSRLGGAGWIAAAVLVVALGVALWALWRAQKPADRPLTRLDVDLGADVSLPAPGAASSVAISPDGTRLVYESGNHPNLFTRRLDQPKAAELRGTEGTTTPFFSPDGQWVGFYVRRKLNKISVEGGAVVPLADVNGFSGASWDQDGSILLGEGIGGRGLVRIPSGGGTPETVEGLGKGEIALAYPQLLPGGKAILFVADTALDEDKLTIEVLTLADHRRKIVARGGASPRYLATSGGAGYLVYVNKATLFAVPFDLEKLETRGTAVPLLDDVAYMSQLGTGQFDFSRTGTLVYRRSSGGAPAITTLHWVDPTGKKEALLAKPGVHSNPSLSPDGKRVALMIGERESSDVWVYDPQRDAMTRLTFGGGEYLSPIWSPDGQYVVFGRLAGGIFQTRADGAGQPQALTQSKSPQAPTGFAPDGKQLAYMENASGKAQIWTVPLENQGGQLKAGKPEQFLNSSFSDGVPTFSPDGRWLAYQSNESGKSEVYVRAFPPPSSGQGGKWQISNSGADAVSRWSRNGHDLLYQSGDQIMAVSYTVKGNTFVPEKPRVWIAKLGGTEWDLAPDGKRVAVLTSVESAEAPKQEHEVVFLENFFDELRRRVPVDKK